MPRKRPNERREKFAREYLVDFNATQAAIRAGYSPKSAGVQAFDLLKDPRVQKIIADGAEKATQAAEVTAERVISEVASVAFTDEVKNEVKVGDKVKALEMLMRYLSLMNDKTKIQVDLSGLSDDQIQALELLRRTGVL